MATQDILLTPGPTPLPPQVREALGRPIIHHRTSQYRAVFKRALQGLQTIMQTSQPVLCLTSSGTGAMEAAVVNLLSPGTRPSSCWAGSSPSAGRSSARYSG